MTTVSALLFQQTSRWHCSMLSHKTSSIPLPFFPLLPVTLLSPLPNDRSLTYCTATTSRTLLPLARDWKQFQSSYKQPRVFTVSTGKAVTFGLYSKVSLYLSLSLSLIQSVFLSFPYPHSSILSRLSIFLSLQDLWKELFWICFILWSTLLISRHFDLLQVQKSGAPLMNLHWNKLNKMWQNLADALILVKWTANKMTMSNPWYWYSTYCFGCGNDFFKGFFENRCTMLKTLIHWGYNSMTVLETQSNKYKCSAFILKLHLTIILPEMQ